jgi:2-keto-4-pentenoate hydratase/2-oxohepta-3-ene-1,7-dioic acid hydratase in catechol pathway
MNYPPSILAVGRNYQHPGGQPPPDHVVFFLKNPASLIGADEPIVIPQACRSYDMVDFEAELAIELGATIKDADAKAARGAIARCMPANDVTCRWWEQHGSEGQLARGKSFDTFCPVGQGVSTCDFDLEAPRRLISRLNGEVMQEVCITEMFMSVVELLVELSRGTSLLKGSMLLTGTPAGIGMQQSPPRYLQGGDVIEIEIEGVGSVVNPVVAGP